MALPALFLWESLRVQTRHACRRMVPRDRPCNGTLRPLRPPFPTHLGPRRDQLCSASVTSGEVGTVWFIFLRGCGSFNPKKIMVRFID